MDGVVRLSSWFDALNILTQTKFLFVAGYCVPSSHQEIENDVDMSNATAVNCTQGLLTLSEL
jgi:hypothetical protein